MLWKKMQHSWKGGLFNRSLMGRTDLAKYPESASALENFVVRRSGCISKRRGTELVCDFENLLGRDNDGNPIPIGNARVIPVERDNDGRYLIFTANRCYVAKKDGVLLCSREYARHIDPYDACDAEGKRKVYSGRDYLANATTPICIRRYSSSTMGYDYFWYAGLQAAYDALQANDVIELHCDYCIDKDNRVTTTKCVSYTIDLCGYTLSLAGKSIIGITHQSVSSAFDLRITSSRAGGRITVGTWGNDYLLSMSLASGKSRTTGKVYLDSFEFVSYVSNTYSAGIGSFASHAECVIDDCIFRNVVTSDASGETKGNGLGGLNCDVTVNSGYFELNCGHCTGRMTYTNARRLTVNGGTFVLNTDLPEGGGRSSTGLFGEATVFDIYGGRFEVPNGCLLGSAYGYYAASRHIWGGYFQTDLLWTNGTTSITLDSFCKGGTVRNTVWPDEHGFYGVKPEGQADYFLERSVSTDRRPWCYSIPYADKDLAALSVCQVADTVFIAHRSYPPAKLTTDDAGFVEYEEIGFDQRKWLAPVLDSAVMDGNDDSAPDPEVEHDTTTRTIRYCVTYVRDGIESPKSAPKSVTYYLPWSSTAVVRLGFSKGENAEPADYFNVYKDTGGGWGLIGSTRADNLAGGFPYGRFNDGSLSVPLPGRIAFQNAIDYEHDRGIGAGSIGRKIVNSSCQRWPSGNEGDMALVGSASFASAGFVYTFDTPVHSKHMRIWFDARVYDEERNYSYVLPSTPKFQFEIKGRTANLNAQGKLVWSSTKTWTLDRYDSPTLVSHTWGPEGIAVNPDAHGFIGWRNGGMIPVDWNLLADRRFTYPNGDPGVLLMVGEGQQTEWFNRHRRYCNVYTAKWRELVGNTYYIREYDDIAIDAIRIVFKYDAALDWYDFVQGVIRGIEVYASVADAATGTFEDDYITPDMSLTPPAESEREHFSGPGEYPACVGMYGEKAQRLVFASTANNPMGFWMSRTGDLYNFTSHESLREDDAIEATIAVTEKPRINHIMVDKYLMLLTDGSEWRIAPISGNAISYKTVCASKESSIGCSRTALPLAVGREIVFVEGNGMTVRAISYSFASEGYDSQDLTVLSSDLFRDNPIVQMAYRKDPDSHLHCVLADGSLATLVYMREHELVAWSKQTLGGGWKARGVASDQALSGGSTDCVILVERGGVWQLWRLRDDDPTMTARAQVTMDGLEFSNRSDAFAEGMTVVTLGLGAYAGGWPFAARMLTVKPEAEQVGTSMYEVQNATEVEMSVIDASGVKVRPHGVEDRFLSEEKLEPQLILGNVKLYDGIVRKTLYGVNRRDGRIEVVADAPWPLTILCLATTYQIEPANRETGGGDGD